MFSINLSNCDHIWFGFHSHVSHYANGVNVLVCVHLWMRVPYLRKNILVQERCGEMYNARKFNLREYFVKNSES